MTGLFTLGLRNVNVSMPGFELREEYSRHTQGQRKRIRPYVKRRQLLSYPRINYCVLFLNVYDLPQEAQALFLWLL